MACRCAFAIPADPSPKKALQPDGTYLTVLMRGDENSHLFYTEDGYPLWFNRATRAYEYARLCGNAIGGSGLVAADKAVRTAEASKYLSALNVSDIRQASAAKPSGMKKAAKRSDYLISDFPTIGRQKSLVILFEFSDVKFSSIDDPHQFYTDMLNQEGFTWTNGAEGSARDFYVQSSFGLFDPEFVVVGPVTLSGKATYYGSDDGGQDVNMGEAIEEACNLLDSEIDFSEYDTNGDGYVDNIYFFYAGGGQADDPNGTDYIWPHSAVVEEAWGKKLVYDGKTIGHYACSNELRYSAIGEVNPTGIGTFVHEFGHVLGLVDHYDTSYGYLTFGLGAYDTMASGSYNNNMNTPPLFSAFERAELAWLDYDTLTVATDTVTLIPDLAVSNRALRLNVPGKDNEFFVMENRQQNGFDAYLPGCGMLVWHIDQDEEAWENNTVNTNASHQRIVIVEADGILSDATRDGDTFPGTAGITQYDLSSWDGDPLVSFDDVTLENDTIRLLLAGTGFRMDAPAAVTASEVEDSSFVVTWEPVAHAKYYVVSISTTGDDGGTAYVEGFDYANYDTSEALTIDGLEPLTTYDIAVSAGLGSYVSEAATASVQTLDLAFAKRKPTGLAATGISAGGFTAAWEAVRDAEGYELTVRRHTYGSTPVSGGYDFTDKADGMPSSWTTTSTAYYSVSGYYGSSAPSLRLSSDGAYLAIAYPEMQLESLSFWCRAKSEGQLIYVETADDGGEWAEAAVITVSTEGKTETVEFGRCDSVRLRYGRTSGFIVIDDIVTTGYEMERIPVSGYDALAVGNVLSRAVSGLDAGATYSFVIRAVMGDELSVSSGECVVTLPDGTGISTVTGGEPSDGDAPVYDLSGRRMPEGELPHGVYIIKGKKIIK